jgi:glyoxylase-like metal-dependent hydrolase (beta-lactamase superfamily II)
LIDSITKKIIPLGDDVEVCSGHGARTIIGRERETNPFLTSVHAPGRFL